MFPPALLATAHSLLELVNQQNLTLALGSCRARLLYLGHNAGRCCDVQAHSHSFHEICYVYRGRGLFRVDERDLPVRAGDLFIARPGQVHQILSRPAQRMAIFFWSVLLQEQSAPAAAGSVAASSAAGTSDPGASSLLAELAAGKQSVAAAPWPLPTLIRQLLEELALRPPGSAAMVTALLLELVLHSGRALGAPHRQEPWLEGQAASPDAARVQLALRFLRDNLHRPIGADDVADQLHVSPRHARRLIHAATGKTMVDHLIDLRMDQARRLLLAQPALPIKQVAAACAYENVSHFTTLFRRQTGQTPAAYRRQGGTKFVQT